jgi:plasmid stabilization system protein ParE
MSAVARLRQFAQTGPKISRHARKLRLHTFPYNVLYIVHDHEILIVAILHQRRGSRVVRARLRGLSR